VNTAARQALLSGPWEPKSYDVCELMGLLEIDALAASLMIRDINSGVEGLPILHWVTHHDLVTYLQII
jgi:hypothetical protein